MGTASNTQNLIINYIVKDLSAISMDDLETNSNLFAEGILDSVGIMRLIAHIETSLCIKIPPADLVPGNFMTIEAMVNYLSPS